MLSIIVAIADNDVIGRDNALPWRLSADLKRFRKLTTGHTIIMGRRTYESIGRPLPDRRSIVLTRDPSWHAPVVDRARTLNEALTMAGNDDEVFIIGGARAFAEALPRADRLYLTRVHADIPGDVRLPPLDLSQWTLHHREHLEADAHNDHPTTFETWSRRPIIAPTGD